MAIQVNWPANKSRTYQASPTAYVKAVLTLSNQTNRATSVKENSLVAMVYASSDARNAGAFPVATLNFNVPAATVTNTIEAYTWLKTQPEFPVAVDC